MRKGGDSTVNIQNLDGEKEGDFALFVGDFASLAMWLSLVEAEFGGRDLAPDMLLAGLASKVGLCDWKSGGGPSAGHVVDAVFLQDDVLATDLEAEGELLSRGMGGEDKFAVGVFLAGGRGEGGHGGSSHFAGVGS
jgi:hypothetical protein